MSDADIEAARAFLADHHRAVLVTRRSSGDLQTSPVAVASDAEGFAVVATREGSAKERNVTRDPRVSLCVLSESWYGPWLHLDGTAEVLRLPDALEPLVDYYRRAAGEHPDWDDFRRAMISERRVLLRIALHRATPLAQA